MREDTVAAEATGPATSPTTQLADVRFRVFAAMAMAATALSIDAILPAFAEMREELDLAPGSPATARLITAFFVGLAIGQIPLGIAADRFGRRPVITASAVVFVGGIAAMFFSSSLNTMLICRFVWGLGAAGLRIGAISMVRDKFVGAAMAREMSFVMAVFLVVPVFAPLGGAALLHFFSWRAILVFCAVFGGLLGVFGARMPETLATPQPFRVRQIATATSVIVRNRTALRYSLVLTALFGVFSSYLASSERIVGDVFGRKSQFPYLFGAVGVCMAVASIGVGRRVESIGMLRVIRSAIAIYTLFVVATLVLVLASDSRPSFWPFWILLTGVLTLHNVLFPNVNSAVMVPVGHVAGTASAVIGTISTLVGALTGAIIDRAFNGTPTPLIIAFAITTVIVVALAFPIRVLSQ